MRQPSINRDFEEVAPECEECQQNHKKDQRTPLHPTQQTMAKSTLRLPFLGQMWLIMVDIFPNGLKSYPCLLQQLTYHTRAEINISSFCPAREYCHR